MDMEEEDQCALETRLMAAVGDGDENAFGEIIALYQKTVFNYFLRMNGDRQKAEDYSQETFLRLYQHAKNYKRQAKLVTYILTIARNCLIDHVRRKKNTESTLSGLEPAAEDFSPERQAVRNELRDNVGSALLSLPEAQREPLVLAVVEDVPYDEVAQILGIPLGTVKSRVFYGLKALREILEKQGYRSGNF